MAGGGQGATKWQQRNCAALQPCKTRSEKCECVPRTELLLKGMGSKVTYSWRVVLFVIRTLWVTFASWYGNGPVTKCCSYLIKSLIKYSHVLYISYLVVHSLRTGITSEIDWQKFWEKWIRSQILRSRFLNYVWERIPSTWHCPILQGWSDLLFESCLVWLKKKLRSLCHGIWKEIKVFFWIGTKGSSRKKSATGKWSPWRFTKEVGSNSFF